MLKISRLTVENMETGCVTENPESAVVVSVFADQVDTARRSI